MAESGAASDAASASASGEDKGQKRKQAASNEIYTRQGNPELIHLTGREVEFQELGDLTSLYDGLATHARQHVNPLQTHLQVPTPAPKWEDMFADPTLPLQVDVGCGSGRFVLIRAKRLANSSASIPDDLPEITSAAAAGGAEASTPATSSDAAAPAPSGKPEANVLGLEIREKLVERAQAWSDRLNFTNCRFIFTNATVSFKSLLASYPGPVELVSMQFPDPYFKKKQFKRRHVQPQLVKEMSEVMSVGSRVFLQGDVPEAVRWMRDMFERYGEGRWSLAPECQGTEGLGRDEWKTPFDGNDATLPGADEAADDKDEDAVQTKNNGRLVVDCLQSPGKPLAWSADEKAGYLPENPLGVPTEREVYVAKAKAPVYRVMLLKTK